MSLPKAAPFPFRRSSWRTFSVLLAIGVVMGLGFSWQKFHTRSLTAGEIRTVIRDYLEVKAGVTRFEPMAIETNATHQVAADGSHLSDEEANSKKAEKKKRKKNFSSHEEIARDFRRAINESADYQKTYRLIGENLARVDELLATPDPEATEAALLLAVGAVRAALDPAVDGWLAARIAEAYLWPNLGEAPSSDKRGIDAASLLDAAEDAFDAADETDNLVRTYRLHIAKGDRAGKTDKYRIRLAKLLESQQKFTEALKILHQVQDTNNPSLARHISGVEIMLQQASQGR